MHLQEYGSHQFHNSETKLTDNNNMVIELLTFVHTLAPPKNGGQSLSTSRRMFWAVDSSCSWLCHINYHKQNSLIITNSATWLLHITFSDFESSMMVDVSKEDIALGMRADTKRRR